jgi:hypothetical protein
MFYLFIASSCWVLSSPQRRHSALIFALIASALLFLGLFRQERKERLRNTMKPFSIYDINIGSAKLLRGHVSILHLFVDGPGRKWHKKQMGRVLGRVELAVSWIRKQARLFKVDLTVENKVLSGIKMCFGKPIPERANHYQSLDEFHGQIKFELQNAGPSEWQGIPEKDRNVCLFVHVLARIRSYAVPEYLGTRPESQGLEYCVIAYGASPSAYAHELLHLFGADDYYTEYPETVQRLKSYFLARSIMFSGGQLPLEHLIIDDLTAQNIGWL